MQDSPNFPSAKSESSWFISIFPAVYFSYTQDFFSNNFLSIYTFILVLYCCFAVDGRQVETDAVLSPSGLFYRKGVCYRRNTHPPQELTLFNRTSGDLARKLTLARASSDDQYNSVFIIRSALRIKLGYEHIPCYKYSNTSTFKRLWTWLNMA